jgi:hypothetical protein
MLALLLEVANATDLPHRKKASLDEGRQLNQVRRQRLSLDTPALDAELIRVALACREDDAKEADPADAAALVERGADPNAATNEQFPQSVLSIAVSNICPKLFFELLTSPRLRLNYPVRGEDSNGVVRYHPAIFELVHSLSYFSSMSWEYKTSLSMAIALVRDSRTFLSHVLGVTRPLIIQASIGAPLNFFRELLRQEGLDVGERMSLNLRGFGQLWLNVLQVCILQRRLDHTLALVQHLRSRGTLHMFWDQTDATESPLLLYAAVCRPEDDLERWSALLSSFIVDFGVFLDRALYHAVTNGCLGLVDALLKSKSVDLTRKLILPGSRASTVLSVYDAVTMGGLNRICSRLKNPSEDLTMGSAIFRSRQSRETSVLEVAFLVLSSPYAYRQNRHSILRSLLGARALVEKAKLIERISNRPL